jgi:antitoxin component of MazEF toxin-antitoxin module
MEKQLTVIGNSLGLIIDKPLRRVLGVGRKTRLRLSVDGGRLIVEPVRDREPGATPAREIVTSFQARKAAARAAFDELVVTWGLTQEHLTALGSCWSVALYRDWLAVSRDDIGLQPAFDRVTVCLQAMRVGRSWEEAIEGARLVVPDRR